jgi:hypothetical protein
MARIARVCGTPPIYYVSRDLALWIVQEKTYRGDTNLSIHERPALKTRAASRITMTWPAMPSVPVRDIPCAHLMPNYVILTSETYSHH